MEIHPRSIADAFNPEIFRREGHLIVDVLADYLTDAVKGAGPAAVLPAISPDEMIEKWSGDFPQEGSGDLRRLLLQTIEQSNHLHHPGYIGHQVTSPLPLSALCEFAGSLLNNASAVYEMGPVNVIMERRLLQWMAGLIGFGAGADGVFTSGGSLGNLTALLTARQACSGYDAWTHGIAPGGVAILVSEQAHYSIRRAACIMGLGESAVVSVPVDADFRMDPGALRGRYDECERAKRRVLLVAASACSTPTGSFDDLEKIADFCEERGVWLHVDAAHGGSLLLTEKYRHLLRGIHRADSVVWDAHKMLLMPALITAVIFKNGSRSYESFSQAASYLFEREAREEWYNYAQRTMECTKVMMGLKLYLPLMVYGTGLFARYVASRVDLAKEFATIIRATNDFELAVEPECNIVCFRLKRGTGQDLDELQKTLRKKALESGKFYIVQTQLKTGFFLRCTIINPLTDIGDLRRLLETLRELAAGAGSLKGGGG